MRLTKFNPETGQYEYIEPAKTQVEFNAQRKAVIQRLGEFEDRTEGEWYTNYNMSLKPSARGRTIYYETYTCSLCGKNNGRHKTNYCPNCGAKMKGENDEQR